MTKGNLRAVTIVHLESLLALFHESGRVEVKMAALFVVKKELLQRPSRDFSPNLKQDLSGLSGFFRQLRSKSCFKMSGLSGF